MTSSITKTHMNGSSYPASSFTNNFKDISGCWEQGKHSGPGQPPSSRALSQQTSHVPRLTHDISEEHPRLRTQTEALPIMDRLYSDGYKARVMFSREPSSIKGVLPVWRCLIQDTVACLRAWGMWNQLELQSAATCWGG